MVTAELSTTQTIILNSDAFIGNLGLPIFFTPNEISIYILKLSL